MTATQVTQSGAPSVLKAFDAEFSRRVLGMVINSAPTKPKTTAPKSAAVSAPSAGQSPTRVARRETPAITRSQSLPVPLYMINEAEYIRQFGY
ncbi:hypothetical protein V1289_004587 [Bradyrhizobium sp. AZCC 2289]